MRQASGFLLFFLLAMSLLLHSPTGMASVTGPLQTSPESITPTPVGDGLAAFPGQDAWIKEVRPTISILVLDDAFGTEIQTLSLVVDTEALIPTWLPDERTVTGRLRIPLLDGSHNVTLSMRDAQDRSLQAAWSFNVDTIPPFVTLAPLPSISDTQVLNVTGTFTEANLSEIRVNGFSPIVEQDTFRVPVLLWPGGNVIQARAVDLAGNVGFGTAEVSWLPPARVNQTYNLFVHSNASFQTEFPSTWDVQADVELEAGTPADVLAAGPVEAGLHPTVVVFSRFAGEAMTEGLFLALMEETLLSMEGETILEVIARPRLTESENSRTLSAEFSVVQTLPPGFRAFVLVTGFWSNSVRRVWLLVGSIATDRVAEDWHALQRSAASFAAIEPDAPPPDGLGPPAVSLNQAFVVTVATTVFILTFFAAILYYRRRKGRREGPEG